MSIERLRALEKAVELVAKATPGPWQQVGSTHSYGIGGDFTPGAFSLVAGGTSGKDCDAVVAAVNFIREHGSALIAELGQEVGADCPLCGGRDCGCGDECEDRKAYGYDIPRAHVEPVAGTVEKIEAARDWIEKAPHGDNCYLDPDHAYGNSCYCGKESILSVLDSPAHTSEARDAAAKFVERVESVASFLVGYGEAAEVAASGLRGALFDYDAAMRQEAE